MADLISFNRCQQSARFFETSHNVRKRTAEKCGTVPRKEITLPPDRAGWSFGELVYWHFYVYGTRPEGNPKAKKGRVWTRKELFQSPHVSDKTLSNWVSGKTLPDNTAKAEKALFGNSLLFDDWRIELAEKLSESRARKAEEAARIRGDAPPLVPESSSETDASTLEDADEISDLAATGKVRKSETENPEIQDNSTESSSDPQRQSGDVPDTEEAGNFQKSAPDSSGESEDFPEDRTPGEQPDARQSHEGEPAGPGAQPGQEDREDDDVKGQGDVPDILRPPYTGRTKSRIVTALIATGAVVIGSYVVRRPHWFELSKVATTSAPSTQVEPNRVPGPQASLPSSPQPAPAPQTPSKREAPQPTPQVASPAPPKPAGTPQSESDRPTLRPRTEEEKRAEEERRNTEKIIEALKRAHEREKREREEEAKRLDREGPAGAATRAQRDREWNARQVAGTGYDLLEYTSVNGTPIGRDQAETVFDCALSCIEPKCDAFAWYRDERPAGPRTCYRYKSPVTFYDHPGFTAGKKRSDLLSGRKLALADSPVQRVTFQSVAQAAPAAPTGQQSDGVTHCPNGPVKVTGFDLTCDAMLVGGTTLGSNRLSWTVKNINECARKCQPIRNCVGFTYNAAQRDGHSCVLFGPTPVKREDVPGWISGERPVQ